MGRAKRLLRALVAALGGVLLLGASLVLAVALHLNTPVMRRVAVSRVNAVLASSFRGRIRIERVASLNVFGLSGADVTLDDPDGRPVLVVHGLRARFETWAALRSVLSGKSAPWDIEVSELSIDAIDARLDSDAEGRLVLVDALSPRAPAPPSTGSSPRGLRLVFQQIAVAHAWAHGRMARLPPLDVEADGLSGAFRDTPEGWEGDVSHVTVNARGIANGADVQGQLVAHVKKDSAENAPVEGHATWSGAAGRVAHSLQVWTSKGLVAAVVTVPPVSGEDLRSLWPAAPLGAFATALVDVRGTPQDLGVRTMARLGDASLDGTARVLTGDAIDFDLHGQAKHLDGLVRLAQPVQGEALLSATGRINVAERSMDAHLVAEADGVTQGSVRLENASIEGHARGALGDPRMDAAVRARGIVARGVRIASLALLAHGTVRAAHLSARARGPDIPDVEASTDLSLEDGGARLDGTRVALGRRGERALVTARRVDLDRGSVRIEQARIDGAGTPVTGDLAATSSSLRLRASTRGVDLACLARIARREKVLDAGILSFDADVDLHGEDGKAKATADLTRFSAPEIPDAAAHLDLTLDHRRIEGSVHASAGALGALDVVARAVQLGPGRASSLIAWSTASGRIDLNAHADLGCIAATLPATRRLLGNAVGVVSVSGHLSRNDNRNPTPDVQLSVKTEGFSVARQEAATRDDDGVVVVTPPRWRIDGIDLAAEVGVDGATGLLQVDVTTRDAKGALATLNASTSRFPFRDLLSGGGRFATSVRTMPFDARIAIPERKLSDLPPALTRGALDGSLQADAVVSGTISAPRLDLTAALRRARLVAGAPDLAVDFDLSGHYERDLGSASVKARADGRDLLDAEAGVDLSPPWKASARVHASGFPLESIMLLDDMLVAGKLSGDLSVDGLHDDARAHANLSIDGLSVGSVNYQSAAIRFDFDGRSADGDVRIVQSDGFAHTEAHAAASWGSALAPSLEPTQPLHVALAAKNFRIAPLLPFLGGALDELDGRIDADTHIALDPRDRKARLSGTLALSRGTVEAAAGGGELHDIAAKMTFSPEGIVTLQHLTASGVSGRLEASGYARLDGTTLQSARATLSIPSRTPIPVTAGGMEIGTVDGRLELTEVSSPTGAANVKVEVPQLRVALHEGSSTKAMGLGPMAKVQIGSPRDDGRAFVLLPLDPVRQQSPSQGGAGLVVETHFGDVRVIRGRDLKVDLDGRVSVKTAGSDAVTGQIRLKRGGTLQVRGKAFVVESGAVTFVGGDPANPEVVVRASWKAPDGTVVRANFTGPLKTGKVTLTSEPQLPQQEIAQLLLFGTADGHQAHAAGASPEESAVGTIGGEAVQPINHALSELGLGEVTANVDTTQSTNPKPEVEIQVARDISLQLAVVLGQPPPGVNPDHTLLTVDWRFLSKWSLSTTLGDAGTTVFDLLWHRRY